MNAPQPSSDRFMEMAAGAAATRQLYEAYVAAGFTPQQAMQLLIALLTNATGGTR